MDTTHRISFITLLLLTTPYAQAKVPHTRAMLSHLFGPRAVFPANAGPSKALSTILETLHTRSASPAKNIFISAFVVTYAPVFVPNTPHDTFHKRVEFFDKLIDSQSDLTDRERKAFAAYNAYWKKHTPPVARWNWQKKATVAAIVAVLLAGTLYGAHWYWKRKEAQKKIVRVWRSSSAFERIKRIRGIKQTAGRLVIAQTNHTAKVKENFNKQCNLIRTHHSYWQKQEEQYHIPYWLNMILDPNINLSVEQMQNLSPVLSKYDRKTEAYLRAKKARTNAQNFTITPSGIEGREQQEKAFHETELKQTENNLQQTKTDLESALNNLTNSLRAIPVVADAIREKMRQARIKRFAS